MSDPTFSPLIASFNSGVASLVVESGGLAGQRFPLPGPPGALLLGRERICNIRFDPERDRLVGRTHARLEVRPDGIYLIDLNSANGTFRADGAAVRGELRLYPGDRFQLGGEGGPWLMLQGEVPKVAIHLTLPISESPTLIARPSDWPVEPPGRAPGLASVSPVADSKRSLRADPVPPSRDTRSSPVAPGLTPDRWVRSEPIVADPAAQQHRRKYQRQAAVIALLLVLACSVGLLLGLRDGTAEGEGEAEISRAR